MRFVETVMGIPVSIDVRDGVDARPAAERAFQVMHEADRRFSTYRPDSEVSRVNASLAQGASMTLSADVREVAAIGEAAARASGGAFRIRRADGSWDLDGVVKGWAAARAAQELRAAGVRDFCLNAGGDVAVSGSPDAGRPWSVGIRSPNEPSAMLAVLRVTDVGVATSGAYERGAHIVDGRDGSPAAGLLSATVVADDLSTADVLATTVFALGPDGVGHALRSGARGVLAVDASGRILAAGDLRFARPVTTP